GSHVGGGKLRKHPLRPVGGPDTNVLTRLNIQSHQRPGSLLDLAVQFGIALAVVELRKNQGVAVAPAVDRGLQYLGKSQAIDPGTFRLRHTLPLRRSPLWSALHAPYRPNSTRAFRVVCSAITAESTP